MSEPSWETFRLKNQHPEEVFESDVALRLFCDKIALKPSEVTCPSGYTGIENIPVEVNGKWYGFQAKHSRNGSQNSGSFDSLLKVIPIIENGDYKLDTIYCFSSGNAPRTKTGKTKKQYEIEKELSKHNITLEWVYQDNILKELQDTKNPILLRAAQRFFEEYPQPPLLRPEPSNNPQGFSRLKYQERLTDFSGRTDELRRLADFTASDTIFSWWLITGKALAGKSRLTLEFCMTLSGDWQWGWIDLFVQPPFDFCNWKPNQNTLIIIDYAMGKETEIQNLLTGINLALVNNRPNFKIRVLLLEREYTDWLRKIEYLETISGWVKANKYEDEPIRLKRLTSLVSAPVLDNDVSLAEQQLEASLPELLTDVSATTDLQSIIRKYIKREENHRWSPTSQEVKEVLVLSTMCGGFDLADIKVNSEIHKEYLSALNNAEEVSKMVGSEYIPNYYPPLEPDIFGELMALDYLNELNPISGNRSKILQLTAKINPTNFVNFMYRCNDNFPTHPQLLLVSDEWKSDAISKNIYSVILANSIDSPTYSPEERLAKYSSLLTAFEGLTADLFVLEKVIFLKILASYPDTNLSVLPFELRVEPQREIILEPNNGTGVLLDSLYPEAYCLSIIEAWRSCEKETKDCLTGPHLIDAFHHLLLIKIQDRKVELVEIQSLFDELYSTLKRKHPHNYMSALIIFQTLCANLITGLHQFNRSSPEAFNFGNTIRDNVESLCWFESEGKSLVLITSHLDKIEISLSVLSRFSGDRDYQYILNCLERIENRTGGMNAADEQKYSDYVKCAVQAANGFQKDEDIAAALEILEKARIYTQESTTHGTASAMTMFLVQFARETERYNLGSSSLDFLEEAIELAISYPKEKDGVVSKVVSALNAEYEKLINTGDNLEAERALSLCLRTLVIAEPYEYKRGGGLYCSSFITIPVKDFVENGGELSSELNRVMHILSTSKIVAWREMMFNINPYSIYYSIALAALNNGDIDKAKRCKAVIELFACYWREQSSAQFIEIIAKRIAIIESS